MASFQGEEQSFIELLECVDRLQVYQSGCKRLLKLALEDHGQLKEQDGWGRFFNDEMCEYIKFWVTLQDPVDRFMLYDDITAKYMQILEQMNHFGVDCTTLISGTRNNSELLSCALALLEAPNGVDQLKTLPQSSLYKAMKLLQRAMNCVSPATDHYEELRTALMRLQRADSTANLEAPDLTPHISDISDEPVAKGGFSDVYTGEWLRQGKVALKILRILGGSGATKRYKLFRKEVKLWHSLRHNHLLQFWGLCNTPQGLAMVSPFMVNGNASAYLQNYPEAGALGLLVGAAYGLEYLHTRQPPITHGDLRGANILVSASGEACLADFGLSKIMEVASTDSSLGMTTANAGATRWLAPELFHSEQSDYFPSCISHGPDHSLPLPDQDAAKRESNESKRSADDRYEGVTPRSDVWAYGMTVYELMTGKVPYYHHKNNATVMLSILQGNLPADPKPNDVRHDWDPELLDIMHETWAIRPFTRPTMSVISARMRAIREGREQTQNLQSLFLAINTPLSPVSPHLVTFVNEECEEHEEVVSMPCLIDSPVSESAVGFQCATVQQNDTSELYLVPPIPDSPLRKKSINRKSTAESTASQREAKDSLAALPDLKNNANLTHLSRPRSSSAPMVLPAVAQSSTRSSREPSTSPTPGSATSAKIYRSGNSSLASLASISNQSKFSKPSRPVTPATPIPDEISSTPSSPMVSKRSRRISSFWKKSSLERTPVEGAVTGDPAKTVIPLLNALIHSQEEMLADTYDATFSTRLRTASPSLVPLERIDRLLTTFLGSYVKLRRQHSLFLKALRSAEHTAASDTVPTIGTLLNQTIEIFGKVYPRYAHGVYMVEEALEEEMERNFPFRAWLQTSDEDTKLKAFLTKPLQSIEAIFVSLSHLVAFAKLKAPKEALLELRDLEQQALALTILTRLSNWQAAMGRDQVVYNWRQLVNRENNEAFADEGRQSAFFKLIESQMVFVRNLKGFRDSILSRVVQSPNMTVPHLQRSFTELTILLDLHSQYLKQMHDHQIKHHPVLTEILNITFASISRWADHYSLYSSSLFDAFEELERYSADIFPLVHATNHPILADQGLAKLLWLPINHLRRLIKSFHILLDATPDNHTDIKAAVEVISTLRKLVELCDSLTTTTGSNPQMRRLAIELQWPSGEEMPLALDDPHRTAIHSGMLLMPQEDFEDEKPYSEVIVTILDNYLLITSPRQRWGLTTMLVLYSVALEDVILLDLDASNGIHDLYLLDGKLGETIAAPLLLQFNMPTCQKMIILLCYTTAEAIKWRRHLVTAKQARESALDAFSKTVLHRQDWVITAPFCPTCSAEFWWNGVKYYVVGGQKSNGLWVRPENEQSSKQVLTGVNVRQCHVVEPMGLLLILTGKSLISLKLEDAVGSKVSTRQVDTKGPVSFFQCAMHKRRVLLIVGVAAGPTVPITLRAYEAADQGSMKSRRSSYFGIKETWSSLFKLVGELAVPHALHGVTIMDDCLILMGFEGFEYVSTRSWINMRRVTFPVFRGLASSQTYDRCKISKPVNAFKSKDLYLLCYSEFGIYVNEHGLTQGAAIEWASERIMQAICMPPYVFLVGQDTIETRLLHSGRLIDRLSGDEVIITHHHTAASRDESPVLHISMKDAESLRQFEVSQESYSVYEWDTLSSC